MGKLRVLSVAEAKWDSDALVCEQESGYGINKGTLRIRIGTDASLVVTQFNHGMQQCGVVVLKDLDIDGLLQYLQDVKQLISEEQLALKLMGKK